MVARLKFEDIKKEFNRNNYQLLSDKDEYKNVESKMKYKCPNGHFSSMSFHNFKSGQRCSICRIEDGNTNIKNTYEYIQEQFKKEGYILISKDYQNNRQKLLAICPRGHIYKVNFHDFNSGRRCKSCFNENRSKSRKLTLEYVKNYFNEQNYQLITNYYENIYQKLDVICPNGHKWQVNWANFKNNECRCSKCPTQISKAEEELYNFIKLYFVDVISGDREIISPLELDIVIPSKKIAIEFCGVYWHSDLIRKNRNYHLNKLNKCNEKNYRLITIFEDEWVNKKDIVKNTLLYILNIANLERVHARNCKIEEIDTKETRDFCNKNHLQGYSESLIKLGAYYNKELIAIMTFSRPNISRNIKNDERSYELTRFCLSSKYKIPGIASKLFKYFINNYNFENIFTYSDRRWFGGNLYNYLGFEKVHNSPPSYWYIKNNSYKRFHRFNFRKNNLKQFPNYTNDKTEYEIMISNGYRRIWDCGNTKWLYGKG